MNRQTKNKGFFITFEGGEACGKSTQLQLLVKALEHKNHAFIQTREPGGTELGEKLRDLLLFIKTSQKISDFTEWLLFSASRIEHIEKIIQPALKQGQIVLCDRFFDSTLAYQGFGRGLDQAKMSQLHAWTTNNLVPDLTILLDLPLKESQERLKKRDAGSYDRMQEQKEEFHQKVRTGFLTLAQKEPQRFLVLDGSQKEETLHQKIKETIQLKLGIDFVW